MHSADKRQRTLELVDVQVGQRNRVTRQHQVAVDGRAAAYLAPGRPDLLECPTQIHGPDAPPNGDSIGDGPRPSFRSKQSRVDESRSQTITASESYALSDAVRSVLRVAG